MLKIKTLIFFIIFTNTTSFALDGLVKIKSNHSVKQTTTNLVNILEKKGMTIFSIIDHKKGAKKAGIELRPTTVVIFGNPKVGTPLMLCEQSVAIDLPQKVLIYKDESSNVWFTYNNPNYIKQRHQIKECTKVLTKISHALANFAKAATD